MTMAEYKGCPLLIQSDTYPSMTMRGEGHTRTYMLECIAEKCAAFHTQDAFCEKFQTRTKLRKVTPQREN